MALFSKNIFHPEPKKSDSLDELKYCIGKYGKLIQDFNGEVHTEVLEQIDQTKRNIERYIEELKQSQNPPSTEQVIENLEGFASCVRSHYTYLNSWMNFLMTGKESIEETLKKIQP